MKALLKNALLIKQLREEVRSRKIFFLVPVYVGILSIVALFAVENTSGSSFNPIMLATTARATMFAFVITMTILLGLISTVLGAASFTTEREKTTFELLELTPLSSVELIWGKFFHAFLIILLILVSSLPVLSTLFYMGGLNYVDVVLTFFYLMLFFAVVILSSSCISIIANRTITSIILSLGIAFVVSTFLGIVSGEVYSKASLLGFAVISPWLVTAQQIFSPVDLKLAGHNLPVWPFYTGFYALLLLLFLAWGRNALDARKLDRNIWARTLGLITINLYAGVGFLCLRSYTPIKAADLENYYQFLLVMIIAILPCFALGTLTDRDQIAFEKLPLKESWHPAKILLNYPPTGLPFLLLLLGTSSITATVSAGVPWKSGVGYFTLVALWILPWFFLFAGMRLFRYRARSLFVTYVLITMLYTLLAFFEKSGKTSVTPFDFYLTTPMIFILFGGSLLYFVFAYRRRSALNHRVANAA